MDGLNLEDFMKQFEDLQNENDRLRARIELHEDGTSITPEAYEMLENENRRLQDDNTRLENDKYEVEQNFRRSENELRRMRAELAEIQRSSKRDDEGTKQLQRDKALLAEKNKQLQTQLNEVKKKAFENEGKNDFYQKQIDSLSKQNGELANAVEELLNRDKEMNKLLRERTQSISDAEEELGKYKAKLKQVLKNRKGSEDLMKELENQEQSPDAPTNYENAHLELAEAKETIKELKLRILTLEEEERRNDRLTEALNKRNIMFDQLQKQVTEKEEQILDFHRAKKELIRQVEMYRERIEEKYHENTDELEDMRKQVEYYKEQYEIADKRVRKFEELSDERMKETDELRRLLNQKLEGTHGLRNAVNELKELRAMIDVRDRHIADLVSQLNSMDKMMIGLSKQVSPGFDLEAFLNNFNTEDFDEEKLRTERASRDLAKKIQMMKDRGPTPQIRVVLNKNQRPTVVYEGDPESNAKMGNKLYKNGHRASDASQKSSIWIPPKQRKRYGQKRFKPTDDDGEKDKTKLITTFAEMSVQTDKISYIDLLGEDDGSVLDGFPEGKGDRDEWVVNLRRKYLAVLQERNDLKKLLDELRAEFDKLQNEHKLLQLDLVESGKSGTKPGLTQSLSRSSLNLELPSSPVGHKYTFDRSNLTDRSSQTSKFKSRLKMDHQTIFNYSKKLHLTRVNITDSKNCVILPSEEDRAIFQAKQNELRIQLESINKESAELRSRLELALNEIAQLHDNINNLQETIDRLNQKLKEERENHKESISQLWNEADRFAESKVREALDVHRVQNRLGDLSNLDSANLDKVSTRIKELNHMKARLEEQLSEEKASSQLAQKQARRYLERLEALEKERDQLKEELERRKTDNKLVDYNANLHIRMKNLEKKYHDLKIEYNELKQSRPARNDPRQGIEHSIDASDDDTANFKNYSLIRSSKTAEAKIMALRTQNEEMQLKLGRAQATIDRLNQLLQRKEGKIEKLKEQASAFKHQVIAKQKEVNALRSKHQS